MESSIKTGARYVVRKSSRRPKGGWGTYCEYAIMLVDGSQGDYVSQISLRAKGALEIERRSGRVHVGSTERSESARTYAAFAAHCAQLNADLSASQVAA